MDQIAGKYRLVSGAPRADRKVIRRMAWGRGQPNVIVDGIVAGDKLSLFCIDDRQDAVPHRVEWGLAIYALPIFEFFFREEISGIGEGRDPAAILPPGVPAHMIAVQMRAHDNVDIVDSDAGRFQGLHPGAVALAVPSRAMRERLVVADA